MSFGLVLLGLEALAVYALVFGLHAARDRLTLVPYYVLLGALAAILRVTTDAGILYEAGPFTFLLGSVVFFTALLFGVFLLYIFDGVQAAQVGIHVVVAVSVLSPAMAWLFHFQIEQAGGATGWVPLSSVRVYVASTSAMVLDFLFIAMLWEAFARYLPGMPHLFRIAACLLSTYWLDAVIFNLGAFWGEPAFESILEGNLVSRAALTLVVAPLLTGYVTWEKRRHRHVFTPRALMALLHRSARRERDLFQARREIAERKRMEAAERAIAEARAYQRQVETRIEETLLRGRPPGDLDGAHVAAFNVPSEHMNGDFTDFVRLNARCFDVVVGDVMGKGILAALVSAGAKTHFLRALSTQLAAGAGDAYPPPSALVRAVHRMIARQLIDLECFLTLCYARFDLDAGTVTYVDCGHTKTIRHRPGDPACTLLEGDNVPLGFLENESYRDTAVDLRPGDTFVFYSDGLTDTRDAGGAAFGLERLIETIQLHASLEVDALTEKILETVQRFARSASVEDDQTCVAVRIASQPAHTAEAKRLAIAARFEQLGPARAFLRGYLARHAGLFGSAEEHNRVVLAYVEAVSNIIRHSYPADGCDSIEIILRGSRKRLQIDLCHGGRPFRPRTTPLPDPGQKREGGYGLYIMNRCFDRIGYETIPDGRQCLVLEKHFNGREA